MKNRWTDSDFAEALRKSFSVAETLRNLGLEPRGGNYRTFKSTVVKLGLDCSHFLGQRHLLGKKRNLDKVSLQDVLVENSEYSRACLKKRLIESGMLKNECSLCQQESQWKGKPLVLILDHLNGVHNDNRLENLRLVCPNCNSQLPTFCGRKNKGKTNNGGCSCVKCGAKITKGSGRCNSCARFARRKVVLRPSMEQIKDDLKSMPMVAVGRKYGVSYNSIKKWLNQYVLEEQKKEEKAKQMLA